MDKQPIEAVSDSESGQRNPKLKYPELAPSRKDLIYCKSLSMAIVLQVMAKSDCFIVFPDLCYTINGLKIGKGTFKDSMGCEDEAIVVEDGGRRLYFGMETGMRLDPAELGERPQYGGDVRLWYRKSIERFIWKLRLGLEKNDGYTEGCMQALFDPRKTPSFSTCTEFKDRIDLKMARRIIDDVLKDTGFKNEEAVRLVANIKEAGAVEQIRQEIRDLTN